MHVLITEPWCYVQLLNNLYNSSVFYLYFPNHLVSDILYIFGIFLGFLFSTVNLVWKTLPRHYCAAQAAKSNLSQLRKKTGIPLKNCRAALEKFDNNLEEVCFNNINSLKLFYYAFIIYTC